MNLPNNCKIIALVFLTCWTIFVSAGGVGLGRRVGANGGTRPLPSRRTQNQRQMLYDYYGRRLRITPKECNSTSLRYPDTTGICMFNLECQEQSGTVIGACVDRFLFGACCFIPDQVKRKEILESIQQIQSQRISTKEKVSSSSSSSPILTFYPENKEENVPHRPHIIHTAPTAKDTPILNSPSPSPTRFPSRVHISSTELLNLRGVSSKDEAVGAEHTDSLPVSLRQHATLPPPSHTHTLLPLTLETFSSVSDPLVDSNHGGRDPLRSKDGQSHDSVERETLGLSFTVKRTRPSSTKVSSLISTSPITTQEPPKISTFMYVGDDQKGEGENNAFFKTTARPTKTTTTIQDDKTMSTEDLQSNTENIWSVMMQLGSQKNENLPIVPTPSPMLPSLFAELATISANNEKNDKVGVEEGATSTNYPPFKVFGDVAEQTTKEEEPEGTTEIFGTAKPWASSTYFVHTFKYPNFTEEEDSGEGTEFVPSSSTRQPPPPPSPSPSSTLPSIGKITTWSGIGTVVDKEQMLNKLSEKHADNIIEDKIIKTTMMMMSTSSPPTTITTNTPTTKTTPKPRTLPTTRRPSTAAPTPTTRRPPPSSTKKHYTTRRTTTISTTTTTEQPTTITPTLKWRKPQPYTLPPHKRPSTTEKLEPEEKNDEDETVDTLEEDEILEELEEEKKPEVKVSNKKPPKNAPVKKNSEKDQGEHKKPVSTSIILDEDMDTNLDDFVEQVVQGLAGSLDNLNIDNVILHQALEHHNSPESIDADLLQAISDPSFPPFPIIEDSPLTKPDKINAQEKRAETTTTTSTTTTTTTQKPLEWKKDCGVRTQQKSGRIVGGTASKFGRWPWQALVKEATWLGLFSKNKCGGVLIAPKYVLTAAHCQPGFLATLTVVLGEFDISSASEGGANSITKNVRRVIVHRDYNAQTFENDIALLELDSPVEFKSHVVPICLPDDNEEEFIGRKAYVTGWGRLKYGGGVPQMLHEVDVPILKNDECQDMFHKSNHLKAIRDSFICAGYADGFKDSCEGDSGGPLSIQRPSGQWVLAGTVSHGIKCAYPNLPGVYMRMTFYKPWIKRVTGIK